MGGIQPCALTSTQPVHGLDWAAWLWISIVFVQVFTHFLPAAPAAGSCCILLPDFDSILARHVQYNMEKMPCQHVFLQIVYLLSLPGERPD